MVGSIAILCSVALLLIVTTFLLPKIKIGKVHVSTYWIVTILGAVLMIACSYISFKEIGEELTKSTTINPLKIICIFLSMTFLSIFEDEMGLFSWIAQKASKHAGKSQIKLFFIIYGLVSILTVFTSNDIVILTFTPFICCFAKNTKINPIPYLIMEFAAANTWSMFLIIGNPTNIYLAASAGINFGQYLKHMALPTLFAGLLEVGLLYLLFRKDLKKPIEVTNLQDVSLKDRTSLITGVVILFACIIMLAISSYINLEMWIICISAVGILLISFMVICGIKKQNPLGICHVFKRLPYELIPFILGMFIVVLALNKQGVTSELASILTCNQSLITYGSTSFIAANIMNNIPMSVFYSFVLQNNGSSAFYQSLYSTIISSNIGAFLTPLGALAGIMFVSLLEKQGITMSFKTFTKYGIILAVPTLLIAFLGLYIVC